MPFAQQRSQKFSASTSAEERVAIRLGQLTFRMLHEMEQVLQTFGLTMIQYNALRILNGVGPDGLTGTEVSERLISKAPDAPRLLDRMRVAGLITRERDPDNRRLVRARITPLGVRRLVESYPALTALHQRQWGSFSKENHSALSALLDQLSLGAS